jgi:hypothetical protein
MEESVGENGASTSEGYASPRANKKNEGNNMMFSEKSVKNGNGNREKEREGSQPFQNSLSNSRRLELLVRLHRCDPERWNGASLNHILRDLAIAKVACSQENVHGTMEEIEEGLLFPLAEICVMQHEKLIAVQTTMSEKEQKYISTILSLQEEKSEIKQGLVRQNMFIETLLQDFDEMGKAIDYSRQKQRDLEKLLEKKEATLQLLISEKEELINKFSTLGSNAVLDWTKGEDKIPDSVKVGPSPCDPVKCEKGSKENNNMQNSIPNIRAFSNDLIRGLTSSEERRPGIIVVTLSGILEEGLESVSSILESGICALPSAIADFWIGLTGRIARHVSNTVVMKVNHSPIGFCNA